MKYKKHNNIETKNQHKVLRWIYALIKRVLWFIFTRDVEIRRYTFICEVRGTPGHLDRFEHMFEKVFQKPDVLSCNISKSIKDGRESIFKRKPGSIVDNRR